MPRKIAVFAPREIGDTVMATPLYQILRNLFPTAFLTLLSEIVPHPVLEGLNIFEKIPHHPTVRGSLDCHLSCLSKKGGTKEGHPSSAGEAGAA